MDNALSIQQIKANKIEAYNYVKNVFIQEEVVMASR